MESATRLRAVLHSAAQPSEIFLHFPHSVQDAYSLRCVPQVHGIVHDTVQFVKRIIYRELNAATGNPMVSVLTGRKHLSFCCLVVLRKTLPLPRFTSPVLIRSRDVQANLVFAVVMGRCLLKTIQ